MKTLKCPKCGEVFTIDEANYASIVLQIKNKEFNNELKQRTDEIYKKAMDEQKTIQMSSEQKWKDKLSEKEIVISNKEAEIKELIEKLNSSKNDGKAKIDLITEQKNREIAILKAEIEGYEKNLELAVAKEKETVSEQMKEKDLNIQELKHQIESQKNEAALKEANIKDSYENKLKEKQMMVEYYKDMKAKLSTKMVGETLEQHCESEFSTIRPLFPNAYFEKDNEVKEGTKGDYIFRDTEEGTEYISIMFEMKNEMEETAVKHKNEDFLKKLDADRRNKKCEYAVLVSMLEQDSELYNRGIVDMSHKYPKMYVIRPQFFIPMITLLVQAAKGTLKYKKELILARNQSVDITKFEDQLNDFKEKFGKNYRLASEKFKTAIDEIDKAITNLQKVKNSLMGSERNLRLADEKAKDLSIIKLTKNNATMQEMFNNLNK